MSYMNWIGIVEKLDEEDSSSALETPVRDALHRAATEVAKGCLTSKDIAIGRDPASLVNLDAIMFMAHQYAERNQLAHLDIFKHTMEGNLAGLKALFDQVDDRLQDILGDERALWSKVAEYKTALAVVRRLIWSYDKDKQEWLPTTHGDEIMRRQPRGHTPPAKTNQSRRNISGKGRLPNCPLCGQSQPQAVIDAVCLPDAPLDTVTIAGLLEQGVGVADPAPDRERGISDPITRGTKRPFAPDGVWPLAKRSRLNREVLYAKIRQETRT